jgi:dTDP-4-dehydrorhamnose 3,5-epimerase
VARRDGRTHALGSADPLKLGSIEGVTLGRLHRFPDARGSFAEAWRAQGSPDQPPFAGVQANLSSSAGGVLRGLHLHRRQSDLWIVHSGVAFVALVDVRPMLDRGAELPTVMTARLGRDDTVLIPPLVAHGFLAIEPLELLYVVTNEYDGTDELGFAWDDPLVTIPWPEVSTPDGRPVLSDRDQRNQPLVDLVEGIRRLEDGSGH